MRMAKVALFVALAALLAAAVQSQTPRPTPRPAPRPTPPPNKRSSVKLVPSADRVTLEPGCAEGVTVEPACRATSPEVKLSARATGPHANALLYTYSTTGGRVEGGGPEVTLDLTGVAPGTYKVTVAVDDGNGGTTTDAVNITVDRCTCPITLAPGIGDDCPTVTVSCQDTTAPDRPVTFTADISGGDPDVTPTFKWSVPGFQIASGQGDSQMTVEPPTQVGKVRATVKVGGYERSCSMTASCTTNIVFETAPRKVGEYVINYLDEEKFRLSNFAGELEHDPPVRGHLFCYGGRRSSRDEARLSCDRARDYLVNTRGITADRIVTVDGGYREELTVELWVVPPGATPPQPSPTVDPQEVRPPERLSALRRRRHASTHTTARRKLLTFVSQRDSLPAF